jgi:DNA replication protein DnaT
MRDPRGVLTHAEGGTLAVFADNAPAFYAITPERLAQLLEIEARLSRPASDVTLDNQFFDEPGHAPWPSRWGNLPCTRAGSRTPIFSGRPRYGALR